MGLWRSGPIQQQMSSIKLPVPSHSKSYVTPVEEPRNLVGLVECHVSAVFEYHLNKL